MSPLKHLSGIILRYSGWKVLSNLPKESHCIILSAPHTSMWDFFWARLYFWSLGQAGNVLVKEELFVFPLGGLLRRMGALPVRRGVGANQVDQIVEHFRKSSSLQLGIAPEGTRKPVEKWKRGFFFIAKATGAPVYLHKTDYQTRTIGIFAKMELSENIEEDMKRLQCAYQSVTPKIPGGFSTGNTAPFSHSNLPGIEFLPSNFS